jgi:hypothetical protein
LESTVDPAPVVSSVGAVITLPVLDVTVIATLLPGEFTANWYPDESLAMPAFDDGTPEQVGLLLTSTPGKLCTTPNVS